VWSLDRMPQPGWHLAHLSFGVPLKLLSFLALPKMCVCSCYVPAFFPRHYFAGSIIACAVMTGWS
jgi:hypothetical protein